MGLFYTVKSRWPEDVTMKFMELYKGYVCLWNIHSPEYKDRDLKRLALENIAVNMGIEGFGVNDVRQKIKNLRCTYAQEISKIEKSRTLEDGTHVYRPNIKWFADMHEIMTFNKNPAGDVPSKDVSKIKLEATLPEDPEDEFEEHLYEYLEDDLNFVDNVLQNDQEKPQINEDTSTNSQTNVPKETVPSVEAPKVSFVSCGYSNTNCRKKKFHDTNLNDESPPEKRMDLDLLDECKAFGDYIGISLKKLPAELSIQAQQEVQEILTRYRLRAMKTTSSPNCDPSPSCSKDFQN